MFELESGDVGSADDFIVRVHAARRAMCLRVLDLSGWQALAEAGWWGDGGGGGQEEVRTSISRKFSGGP